MKKIKGNEKLSKFGKCFFPPYVEPDYYKKYTYDDIFREIKKQLSINLYIFSHSADSLPDNVDLTKALKHFIQSDPELFKSDSPRARKLVAHFGDIINTYFYGQGSDERIKAKNTINDILTKPCFVMNKKNYIPHFLLLKEMFSYLHKITDHLKDQYMGVFDSKLIKLDDIIKKKKNRDMLTMNILQEADQRLIEFVRKGQIENLIKKPTELTMTLMADFFGMTFEGMRKKINEEKNFLMPIYDKR